MRKNNFLFITLVLFSCLTQAGVYKHIDERGNVTYSNIPSSNSKKIDLPPIVVVPPATPGISMTESSKEGKTPELRNSVNRYKVK